MLSRPFVSPGTRLAKSRPMTSTEQESISGWIDLVRAEYHEIPGLHLTKPQVQRLWGLDPATCDALREVLVDVRFLRRTPTGAYVRANAN